MNKFGKILLPLITPFDNNEEVNYSAFKQLINYVIDKNFCDTIVVSGTTGEFNTLTFDERVKLFHAAVKAVDGRKPVIAGTGCASTKETIALSVAAHEAGIDTCMIVAPFYCKPIQEEIYEHFSRIAVNISADIMLYNIPIFTGVNIEAQTLAALIRNRKFIGIKDESGMNPTQITEYYWAANKGNKDFLIFNGDDLMLMPTIAQGAAGIVSGGSHLAGDKVRSVFEKYSEGKVDEALAIYRDIFRLFKIFGINNRIHPNPILRKAIEMVTGIKVNKPRMPLNDINASEQEELLRVLREANLL